MNKRKVAGANALAIMIIGIFFLSWELIVRLNNIPLYILPSPVRVLVTLSKNTIYFGMASIVTFSEAVLGLILGSIAGILAATILGFWPRLERAVMTLAILVKSTPLVAIAPLLTIWLGFGVLPKLIITGLLTFFPILVNAFSGFNSVSQPMLNTFHSWNANRFEIFWYLRLPSALPHIFAALKISGPLSIIGAVVAEWTGASSGLGRVMWLAYTNLKLDYLFAAVFILAAAGIGLYGLLVFIEKKNLFWLN